MWECKNGREQMDLKLAAIRFFRKIWVLAAAMAAGGLILGFGYFVKHVVLAPVPEYQAFSMLYVDFVEGSDGKPMYYTYNDAGWAGFVKTDVILDMAMGHMPSPVPKEELRESVSADIAADYRFVELTVTNDKPDTAVAIAHAMEKAFMDFAGDMQEIEQIRIMTSADSAKRVLVDSYTYRAVIWGAILAGTLVLLSMAFYLCLDDSIYVPAAFEQRYGIPMLGLMSDKLLEEYALKGSREKAKQTAEWKEFQLNLEYVREKNGAGGLGDYGIMGTERRDSRTEQLAGAFGLIALPSVIYQPEASQQARACQGILLNIQAGTHNGKRIEKVIGQLQKNDCNIVGAILSHADNTLLSLYYFGNKAGK